MYELLFSPQAERYFKKVKEKPLKEAYKTALLKIGFPGFPWFSGGGF